jgi:predicted aspartyl protease
VPTRVETRQDGRALRRHARALLWSLFGCGIACWGVSLAADVQPPPAKPQASAGTSDQNVSVQAPEPRYVARTLRDQIGRIWAPVFIDGKGPFRLVLDTGANHSAVTAQVAQALGIPVDESAPIELRGVTGSATVPTIHVENLLIGDLLINSPVLPIVPDALGGAQGVLGTEGLLDKRILIDFLHDRISIKRSRGWRANFGFVTVPMKISDYHLLTTTAWVGSIRATAIIDTGAESSIANLALRRELMRHRSRYHFADDEVLGATDDVSRGQDAAFPPIALGDIVIRGAHITTGNLQIFDIWKLTEKPAILIGMDALGMLDELVIDYRRHELQILVHHDRSNSVSWPEGFAPLDR